MHWLIQFQRLLNAMIVVALVAMIGLVFANVVLRYGFSTGIRPSVELSRLLFVWVTMVGAMICLQRREHLELRMLEFMLPPSLLVWQRRLVNGVIFVLSVIIVLGCWRQLGFNWANALPVSRLPQGLFDLAGVVAGAGMALIALTRLVLPRTEPDVNWGTGQ